MMGRRRPNMARVCMMRREDGWLRVKDAAKGRVDKIPAMLVGDSSELLVDYGRLPKKII